MQDVMVKLAKLFKARLQRKVLFGFSLCYEAIKDAV